MPTIKNHQAIAPVLPKRRAPSVLAWPAWRRVLLVLPVVALLWLAVAWAQLETT